MPGEAEIKELEKLLDSRLEQVNLLNMLEEKIAEFRQYAIQEIGKQGTDMTKCLKAVELCSRLCMRT